MRTTTIQPRPAVTQPAQPLAATPSSATPAPAVARQCRPAPARRTIAGCATLPTSAVDGRRLVLVDIENVVGGSRATAEQVRVGRALVREQVEMRDHDVWVIACGRDLLATAMPVLPRTVRLGRGVDGADDQLLAFLEPDQVVGHYASVVVVSGDGRAFAAHVAALRALDVPTDVVARPGTIGHSLYRTARSFTPLAVPAFALAA
ncbi:MAG: hypothetical protein ACO3C1_04615 [Ilumatobacteraceae bacterium]